jgi:hypothetical protein
MNTFLLLIFLRSSVRKLVNAPHWERSPEKIERKKYINEEIGNEATQFISGNICFEFSV